MPNYLLVELETFRTLIKEELSAFAKESISTQTTSSSIEQLKTRKEMAKCLNISLVTLGEWMKKGLPYRRLNGRIYFLYSEVMDHMKFFANNNDNHER